jgi:hypothetical protein
LDRPHGSNDITKQLTPAELLQRSYEAHLASLQKEEQGDKGPIASSQSAALSPCFQVASGLSTKKNRFQVKKNMKKKSHDVSCQATVEEDEGRQLMVGFLQSLRGSFEDALSRNTGNMHDGAHNQQIRKQRKKRQSSSSRSKPKASEKHPVVKSNRGGSNCRVSPKLADSNTKVTSMDRYQNRKRNIKPASVTETSSGSSSQPTTEQSSSSIEDFDSKSEKTDQSSTSDEFENDAAPTSKGPPRKRLKILDNQKGNQFTVENVLEHSIRMDLKRAEDLGSASD